MEDLFRIPPGFLVSVSALSPPWSRPLRQIYEQRWSQTVPAL